MLYKYCKPDGIDILLKARLRTSQIETINDPFELASGIDKKDFQVKIKEGVDNNDKNVDIYRDELNKAGISYDPCWRAPKSRGSR